MQEQVEIEPVEHDPLQCGIELPLRVTCHPLGFPLELATNSQNVIDAASQSWGHFTPAFAKTPVSVSITVLGGGPKPTAPPVFRSRAHVMSIVCDADNSMICDFSQHRAFGWVTPQVAEDPVFFRLHFLDATVMSLLVNAYLAPVHGALIAREGRGVVLCGTSHAGKSTLAYACARAGWTYLADDGTFLVRDHSDRYAIGNPHTVRFREDARRLFPELTGRLAGVRPNGKIGMEIFTRDLPISIGSGCPIDHVVFLKRDESGPARLDRYSAEQASNCFAQCINYGENSVRDAQRRAYRRLLSAGIWEMRYHDLGDAVLRLERLVRNGN